MPIALSIEPGTACNLQCPQCPTGMRSLQRPKGQLSLSDYEQWLPQVAPHLFTMVFYLQGEPFLHPQLPEFIRLASLQGVFTQTSTNGHYLTPDKADAIIRAGLHKLIVSVDGPNQSTYSAYRRGGQLDTVLQGIRTLQARKKQLGSYFPMVEMQFLVLGTNEHLIPQMRQLARELGVRLRLKSAQIYDYQNGSPLIPSQSRYSRYRAQADGTWAIKSKLRNRCWRQHSNPVLTWDGQLLPCCFDKDASYSYGNLHNQTFVQAWNSPAAQQFAAQLHRSRAHIDMCRNCTEGLRL